MRRLIAACLALMLSFASNAQEWRFRCTGSLDGPYGICSHISRLGKFDYTLREKDLAAADALGLQWIRTDFDWDNLQWNPHAAFDFSRLDGMMASADSAGIGILPIITDRSFQGNNANSLEPLWTNYITTVFKRFRGRIRYVELINEPDISFERHGFPSPEDYVAQARKAAELIRAADPGIILLGGGMGHVDSGYLEACLKAGLGDCVDVLNMHYYSGMDSPETILDQFRKLHELMLRYSVDKPVWLTETGYSTAGYSCQSPAVRALAAATGSCITEEMQSRRLPQTFLMAFAYGMDKVFWYHLRAFEDSLDDAEAHYGILHSDFSLKPAFQTYRTLTGMCPDGSSRPSFSVDGRIRRAEWTKPDGSRVVAIWTPEGQTARTRESGIMYDCYGNRIFRIGRAVRAGQEIVYIVKR